MEVVCGVDIGTSGARAFAVAPDGKVVARAEAKFAHPPYQPEPGWAEQDANEWWQAAQSCLQSLTRQLGASRILALAVDSTSGTFVPVDADGTPLSPALMYNDGRATGLDADVNQAAGDFCERLGYTFPPAFALVKLLWLKKHRPEIVNRTHKFMHAADFVVGKLTGNFNCTDTSNALKSGVDLLSGDWPEFIETRLGLPLAKFPQVFRPGSQVGEVSADAAASTCLPAGTPVIAGVTDGTASFLASGAKAVGDWNLTIGTTIAIRGVSESLMRDPLGRLYCHRHPEGYWLPGGASNVGGEALLKVFGAAGIADLDQNAPASLPSSLVVYPLVRKGERMPFVSSEAEGFIVGQPKDEADLFAGYLEGIALIAAWSLQAAHELGAPVNGEFFLSGGGAHGKTLGTVLASALERALMVAREPEAAMGSALLAAGWAWHGGSVSSAQAHLTQRAETFEPLPDLAAPLKMKLQELKAECRQRGYC
jgi:xylulokinase